MLAGMDDLLSVTGEVAVVPETPVAADPTTTSGVELILPASYASASSCWMRKTSSEISASWEDNELFQWNGEYLPSAFLPTYPSIPFSTV
jgi:hypothetical protein